VCPHTRAHSYTLAAASSSLASHQCIVFSLEQVRASVPMYLLARRIKAEGFKMVMSGEGADELFGGYLYFHKAPDAAEFHRECQRKTTRLHQWDVLRANKSTMAWGIETRTPLLSQAVCDYAMNTAGFARRRLPRHTMPWRMMWLTAVPPFNKTPTT